MQHFVECVRLGRTPTPDVADGYRVDRLIADAYRSGLENREIDVVFRDEDRSRRILDKGVQERG